MSARIMKVLINEEIITDSASQSACRPDDVITSQFLHDRAVSNMSFSLFCYPISDGLSILIPEVDAQFERF
jgi:hypothetical protein